MSSGTRSIAEPARDAVDGGSRRHTGGFARRSADGDEVYLPVGYVTFGHAASWRAMLAHLPYGFHLLPGEAVSGKFLVIDEEFAGISSYITSIQQFRAAGEFRGPMPAR